MIRNEFFWYQRRSCAEIKQYTVCQALTGGLQPDIYWWRRLVLAAPGGISYCLRQRHVKEMCAL
jgi:hypothetical protein